MATVIPLADIGQVAKLTPPAAGAVRVYTLKGADYLRIWINDGGTHYLIYLPVDWDDGKRRDDCTNWRSSGSGSSAAAASPDVRVSDLRIPARTGHPVSTPMKEILLSVRCQRSGTFMDLADPGPDEAWTLCQFWVCPACDRHFWTTLRS